MQTVQVKVKDILQTIGADVSTSNSKMPGAAFGLSTDVCATGGKLRDVCGSVCEKCYARKLEYLRPSVHQGYTKRADAVRAATETQGSALTWINAMAIRITTKCEKLGQPFMRWHDSGDLVNFGHLIMIAEVAKKTPHLSHWLPTKEKKLVKKYLRIFGDFPDNLIVRVSSAMVDGEPLQSVGLTATVNKDKPAHGFTCPANQQGNQCGDCRACWDKTIDNVSYPFH